MTEDELSEEISRLEAEVPKASTGKLQGSTQTRRTKRLVFNLKYSDVALSRLKQGLDSPRERQNARYSAIFCDGSPDRECQPLDRLILQAMVGRSLAPGSVTVCRFFGVS
jgi:hypothetical protein